MQNPSSETVRAASGAAREPGHYYLWASVIVAALAALGFAPTFYLRPMFHSEALALPVVVHGLLMSSWCVLLIVQASLVAGGRVNWHRRVGVLGAALAAVIVGWGIWLTVRAVAIEGATHVGLKFHYLLGLNVVNMLLFAALVAAAIRWRTRPEYHKRLMLLATVTLLAPALARIVILVIHGHSAVPQFAAFYAAILACVVVDALRHRRLHPALAWGAVLVIGTFQVTYWMEKTDTYIRTVREFFG